MKEIQLLIHGEIQLTSSQPVNLGIAITNLKIARINGSKIIWAALLFERQLESIVLRFFFEDNKDKMIFFKNHILSSDWFTLSAKRKFLIAIFNDKPLLTGEEKVNFEEYTKKVISLRNAFTHGNIVEKNEGTFIVYFEGRLQERELNDEYWNSVEKVFKDVTEITNKIEQNIAKLEAA